MFLFNCLGISAFFLPPFIVIIVDFSTFLGLIFFDLLVLEIKVFLFAVLRFVFFFFDFFEISGEPYFNEPAAKSEKKIDSASWILKRTAQIVILVDSDVC